MLHKIWREGNAPSSLIINSYSADEDLRVVKSLNRYFEVTEERREGKTQLLLCFKKPYREIELKTPCQDGLKQYWN